jgi:hypothetical protein
MRASPQIVTSWSSHSIASSTVSTRAIAGLLPGKGKLTLASVSVRFLSGGKIWEFRWALGLLAVFSRIPRFFDFMDKHINDPSEIFVKSI